MNVLCCAVYDKCILDNAHPLSWTINMLFNRVFCPIAMPNGQIPVVTQEHDDDQNVSVCQACRGTENCIEALSGQVQNESQQQHASALGFFHGT